MKYFLIESRSFFAIAAGLVCVKEYLTSGFEYAVLIALSVIIAQILKITVKNEGT
jgi:hypothetical protein